MRRTGVVVESAIILYLSLASIFEVLSCAFGTDNYSLSLDGNAMMGAREEKYASVSVRYHLG